MEPAPRRMVDSAMLLLFTLAVHAAPYDDAIASLETTRATLQSRYSDAGDRERAQLRALGRQAALTALDEHLFPAWIGTSWDFYGTSTIPGTGEIACGYFVSTTLRDAGFRVERVRLAQQASEHIIQTFVPESAITRFRDAPLTEVLDHLDDEGDGLYIIGLDHHVGFLRQRGASTTFCHSSYLGDAEVICEPALSSPALRSRYRVVGRLFDEAMIEAWILHEPFTTVGPMRK